CSASAPLDSSRPSVPPRRSSGPVDPLRETAQRALMQTLASSGNYAAAIQAYRELRLVLHREINADPDPETTALISRRKTTRNSRERKSTRLNARHVSTPFAVTFL